jgi:guanylate kinase
MSEAGEGAAAAPRTAGGRPGTVEGAPGALVVIISGPSGVGKDTIIDAMRRLAPRDDRDYVITCTTRPRRDYEVDGVHYLFLSEQAFAAIRDAHGFLEHAVVHGNWYGTPRDQVVDALVAGRDAILKIDVQGARAVRALIPGALLIFVVPPSVEELTARLVARSSEGAAQLERRLRNATAELARKDEYDHVVVNETGQVDRTADEIEAIIAVEHGREPNRRLRV